MTPITGHGYLITRHSRDQNGKLILSYYLNTPHGIIEVCVVGEQDVFFTNAAVDFLPQVDGLICETLPLKSFAGEPVTIVRCDSLALKQQAVERLRRGGYELYEEDIAPQDRYLMERGIRGLVEFIGVPQGATGVVIRGRLRRAREENVPQWQVWSIDIETSVSRNEILSIGIVSEALEVVLAVQTSECDLANVIPYGDEKALLLGFMRFVRKHQPHVFIGWNVIGFDIQMIDRRCRFYQITPAFGVQGEPWHVRMSKGTGKAFATIPGRVVLDGITLLKVGGYHFDSYSLNHVSAELLGEEKLLTASSRWQEIERLYAEEFERFIEYNLQDCRLVAKIFAKLALLTLQQTRVDLTGIPLEQTGGSVASFENLYLPRLHRSGYVAPSWRDEPFVPSPGGFVMNSVPGLFRNVLVFDFKSLYPSIIRTFFIDPLARVVDAPSGRVPGFRGAAFNRQVAILPALVGELAEAREQAKAQQQSILSYAIKIIMNSFYGVLGSDVCRFYHPQLASSITLRGHELLNMSKEWMEQQGAKVIYGDTDSLFVWLGDDLDEQKVWQTGEHLCAGLNQYLTDWCWQYAQLESHLELEFETLYSRFYMPTIRGQEEGSKKRYAGLSNGSLVFKGLEATRSDWTELARRFQTELFEHLFHDRDVTEYVKDFVARLHQGEFDHECIYRKQLTKPVSSYIKVIPPHVRVAKQIDLERQRQGLEPMFEQGRQRVEYFYSLEGAQPFESYENLTRIDYDHYINKQLLPIAEGVLALQGIEVMSLLTPQFNLI
ncbi:DNA polymerase II [Maribrevibacterium harenarium]|uniref:DNA polymerase n=1 Tax=Maribrevibacterium harenarium TaxID=2589817 RepID=A0A501X4T1_9GAMM|nr:DNA polymerase II [Maribrevibacterium harenarium]TPE55525.1 DNA polymerase II [Maribrevibacterium harenarium]